MACSSSTVSLNISYSIFLIIFHPPCREGHPVEVDAAGRERRVAAAAVHAAVRGVPVTAAGAAPPARARPRLNTSHYVMNMTSLLTMNS